MPILLTRDRPGPSRLISVPLLVDSPTTSGSCTLTTVGPDFVPFSLELTLCPNKDGQKNPWEIKSHFSNSILREAQVYKALVLNPPQGTLLRGQQRLQSQ